MARKKASPKAREFQRLVPSARNVEYHPGEITITTLDRDRIVKLLTMLSAEMQTLIDSASPARTKDERIQVRWAEVQQRKAARAIARLKARR